MITKDLQTEAKIKEAALALFEKYGSKGTTVRKVAEKAGVNLALMNYYFQSKDKLFLDIFNERFGQYRDFGIALLMDRSLSFEKRLENYYDEMIAGMDEHPGLPMFILSELHFNENLKPENGLPDSSGIHLQLEAMLQEEFAAGKIRKISALEFQLILVSQTVFPYLMSKQLNVLGQIPGTEQVLSLSEFMKTTYKANFLEMVTGFMLK
ncbi:TetR/AcrR family transcriptional regulator [Algoriphagus sp. H41]|uniref:TetR/AcrR family transcriptional regulator n=1 Tax=Algoriphagus oliviformis TaxID=2811231 RepID=A0ABS3C873_9BACT|nr:TetR/AcrR family transcriptional regulator [Algoriphagus oliviformis]MBN7812774.1 TetR/AcrR family transcriptional regulator [Algoriphagus oliviformis]